MSTPHVPFANHILAYLPTRDSLRILPFLTPVVLEVNQVLCELGKNFEYVYFPTRGAVSAVKVMEDGESIEIGTIGFEGMVGLPLLMGIDTSFVKIFVQVEGTALRMSASKFKEELEQSANFRKILNLYNLAFLTQVSQSVACNGLHKVGQRCSRWLLETHDRYMAREIPLTHEILAILLGVRRSSVTEVLRPLQAKKLIECRRGKIIILDRSGLEASSCECYRAILNTYVKLFSRFT